MRFWHIAHPSWTPGQPLMCRDALVESGADIPWLWDEADEGLDTDRVCLFPDTDAGRQEAAWLAEDRPDYSVVRVDLPEEIEVGRATWESYPAVFGHIPADCLTVGTSDDLQN